MKRLLVCILAVSAATVACRTVPVQPPPPAAADALLPMPDWLVYSDPAGFSIQHPLAWQRVGSEGYPVTFGLPSPPGTTLLEKRMEIDVREVAGECRQSAYGAALPAESHRTINGVDFLRQSGTGIAAGNIYDWTSYSTPKAGNCITITFVLHSSSSGVYATEPAAYDRAAESVAFDEMLGTFRWDK